MTLCREACETVTGFWLSDVDFPRSWVTIRKRSAQQVVILIWREKEKVLQVPSGAADTNSAIGSACRWRCSYWNESIFSCVAWGKKKETKKRRFIEWPNIFPSNAAPACSVPTLHSTCIWKGNNRRRPHAAKSRETNKKKKRFHVFHWPPE